MPTSTAAPAFAAAPVAAADGDGFITQEHFAQVYGELFVDEAPERIEEVSAGAVVGRSGGGVRRCLRSAACGPAKRGLLRE